jgi:hypothetical protein
LRSRLATYEVTEKLKNPKALASLIKDDRSFFFLCAFFTARTGEVGVTKRR